MQHTDTCNMLKISKLRMGGGKFAARILLIALLIVLLVFSFLQGFRSVTKPAVTSTEVEVRASLFHNRDSVNYYAERAYLLDDPQGQFVVGACYYLRQQGDLPEEIYAVSHDEADDFLIRSALQGFQPALDLIRCLNDNGCWHHPLPETK